MLAYTATIGWVGGLSIKRVEHSLGGWPLALCDIFPY